VGNGGLVALAGTPHWLLRAPTDGLEQPPDMDGMVGNTEFEANDGRHACPGPDLSPEAIRFGPTLQEGGQAGELFVGQPAWRTRGWAMPEGFQTALAGPRHPLADGALADAQGVGDLALRPALVLELPGLEPPGCFPIRG
jgi:hypothetical protein